MGDSTSILNLDFDGVIHSYKSGWQSAHVIPDPPVDGIEEWLYNAVRHFKIAVFSSRTGQEGGVSAMKGFVIGMLIRKFGVDEAQHIMERIYFPSSKPPARVGIDDRVLQFNGDWKDDRYDPATLAQFQPWWMGVTHGSE